MISNGKEIRHVHFFTYYNYSICLLCLFSKLVETLHKLVMETIINS